MLANMLSLVIFGNRAKKRLGVLNKTKVKLRCKLIPVCFFPHQIVKSVGRGSILSSLTVSGENIGEMEVPLFLRVTYFG